MTEIKVTGLVGDWDGPQNESKYRAVEGLQRNFVVITVLLSNSNGQSE